MKFTINSEEIRQGEFTKALLYLSKNKVGRSLALEYLTENSDVVDRLAKDGIKPDKIFPELIETFTSDHEVEGFAKTSPVNMQSWRVKVALASARNKLTWGEQNYDVIKTWLMSKDI
ncbi:uncharacterized protein [Mytilus edulis]|uniref:uncharacterized protein n=1 Tax=Mytilus edulis TaxID=6550 RepID=UPI0039EFBB7D